MSAREGETRGERERLPGRPTPESSPAPNLAGSRYVICQKFWQKTSDLAQTKRASKKRGTFYCFKDSQSFIFSARHQLDTWTHAPPGDTWYGGILWVLRVLGQDWNQSARIFFIRAFSGCYAIVTSPKKGETVVYGYNPALFWVFSVSCRCLAGLIFT